MKAGRALTAGVAAVTAVVLLRRRRTAPERADLYFDDGSLVSLDRSSPDGARLLALAEDVLRAQRTAA